MNYRVMDVRVPSAQTLAQWFAQADAARQAHTLRLTSELARRQSLCADHLARELLAQAYGCETPIFSREANGKPVVENLPVHLSLSHSGSFAVCAVHERPVGADLEAQTGRPRSLHSLLPRICTEEERAYILREAQRAQTRFLQVWTAKEAALKRMGRGVFTDLKKIAVVSGGELTLPSLHLCAVQTEEYVLSVVY